MDKLSLGEQILYSTVKIVCHAKNNTVHTSGTGFIYGACQCEKGHFSVLITNKHVIDDIESCELTFHLQDEDGHVLNENLIYRLDGINKDTWLRHPDSKIDLAMLNLSPIFEHISNSGKKVFYTCLDSTLIPNQEDVNSFSVIEDIIMLGYPNGIIDEKNNLPIVRKGITATSYYTDFNGNKQFLADISCYPGSSGSPILVFQEGVTKNKYGNVSIGGNKIKLLGINSGVYLNTITGDLVTQKTDLIKPLLSVPNNLAIIIKSEMLLDFDRILQKFMNNN